MNPANSQPGDLDGKALQAGQPAAEPPDAQVIPIKRDTASIRAQALQIIDEYDGLLQRLVEIVGNSR